MRISVPDLIFGFSRALDMVKPQLAGHHLGVAWIASELAGAFASPDCPRAAFHRRHAARRRSHPAQGQRG